MNNIRLREALCEELELLIHRVEKYLPQSLTIYGMLVHGFRKRFIDAHSTKLYIPVNSDLPLFIVIVGVVGKKENRNNMTAFWDPKEISNEIAKSLLKTLPHWNWDHPSLFSCMSIPTLNELQQIMSGSDGLSSKLNLIRSDGHTFKRESTFQPFQFNLDPEFVIAPLDERFAADVHANWKYNFSNSVDSVKHFLLTLPSIAVFARVYFDEANGNNQCSDTVRTFEGKIGFYKPVSWALCRFFGEIGFNFTYPDYRNKGLSTAVTAALAQACIDIGISPHLNICGHNPSADTLAEKAGFKKYCPVGYHMYLHDGMQRSDY